MAPYGKNLDFNTLPRVNAFGLATLINVKYIHCSPLARLFRTLLQSYTMQGGTAALH